MEASGVGVNSPEFLQKKIDRLKTALDEANVLMDRHVTERDEARAQLDALRRENADLKRQLEEGAGAAAPEVEAAPPPVPAVDPELERELRERIARLEGELEVAGQRVGAPVAVPGADPELQARIDSLQRELEAAQRERETAQSEREAAQSELENSRRDIEAARREADAARRDSDAARAAVAAIPVRPDSTAGVRSAPDMELPPPGALVSPEGIRGAPPNDHLLLFFPPLFPP